MNDPRITAALAALANGSALFVTKGDDGKARIEFHAPGCSPIDGCSCGASDVLAENFGSPTANQDVAVTRYHRVVYANGNVQVAIDEDAQSLFSVMERVMKNMRRAA